MLTDTLGNYTSVMGTNRLSDYTWTERPGLLPGTVFRDYSYICLTDRQSNYVLFT